MTAVREYYKMCVVVILVLVRDEDSSSLVGTCWYTLTPDSYRVLIRRSERMEIDRLALEEIRRKEAWKKSVLQWDADCRKLLARSA